LVEIGGFPFVTYYLEIGTWRRGVKGWGNGGDRGIRTPDLRDANAALSQLSYIPVAIKYIIAYPG
jgi:hypothetical protein